MLKASIIEHQLKKCQQCSRPVLHHQHFKHSAMKTRLFVDHPGQDQGPLKGYGKLLSMWHFLVQRHKPLEVKIVQAKLKEAGFCWTLDREPSVLSGAS